MSTFLKLFRKFTFSEYPLQNILLLIDPPFKHFQMLLDLIRFILYAQLDLVELFFLQKSHFVAFTFSSKDNLI